MGAESLAGCLELVLRPLARLFLRKGLAFQEFSEIAKRAFVHAAKEEFEKDGVKVNPSRIMAATGLHRAEVNRLLEPSPHDEDAALGLIGKLVGHWEQDPQYSTRRGPRRLTVSGAKGSFEALVRAVNTHVTPGTILFQLERLGMVAIKHDYVHLIRPVEQLRSDPQKLFGLCARDLSTLLQITEQNVTSSDATPLLHLRTEYDNIYADKIPHIRAWLLREGSRFHKKIRDFVSEFDADVNPDPARLSQAGRSVVLGSFGFSED